jgi:hypothetical protein
VPKIKNLTVSIDLPTLKNKTKKMTNTTTAVAAMPVDSTNAFENGTKLQDNSGGGCPCNSQGWGGLSYCRIMQIGVDDDSKEFYINNADSIAPVGNSRFSK